MNTDTCCVTGHRHIPSHAIAYVTAELRREIQRAIDDGYTHFVSGFADGVDLLFASIVVEMKHEYPITLEAAIPHRNRLKTTDRMFCDLIHHCDRVRVYARCIRALALW